MHLLDPRMANEFLNSVRRRRVRSKAINDFLHMFGAVNDVGNTNASEECCLEGCNTEEILEYAC